MTTGALLIEDLTGPHALPRSPSVLGKLFWDRRGVVIDAGRRVFERAGDPFASPNLSSLALPWSRVLGLTCLEPWPAVRVHFKEGSGAGGRLVLCDHDAEAFAEHIEDFAHELSARRCRIAPGWLSRRDVRWQPVPRMPSDHALGVERVGYRQASAPTEAIIAHSQHFPRSGPERLAPPLGGAFSPGHALWYAYVRWKSASRMQRDVLEARVIDVTHERVYVRPRRHPFVSFFVPLNALVARLDEATSEGVMRKYIFGRRCRLLVRREPWCQVQRVLDQHLGVRS